MRPQKVAEILGKIKNLLENQFTEVMVEGEISNFSRASSGHYYFSLSDETASIAVAIFKNDAYLNPLLKSVQDGQKVIVVGRLGVYAKRGTFQIIGQKIYPFGTGNLKIQFELLKNKLAGEGLFDVAHKKDIPPFPRRVAIITALDGAALQDFLQVYQRRSRQMDILVVPSLVQGEAAPASLKDALAKVWAYQEDLTAHPERHPGEMPIEVVVLARGGGSMEDLWCFNDESLAYAMYAYPLPIINAVGHQVDFTIADYVADCRAETPTAAAELLTAAQVAVWQRLQQSGIHLKQAMWLILAKGQKLLAAVHPRRWAQALGHHLQLQKNVLQRWAARGWPLMNRIHLDQQYLDELKARSGAAMQRLVQALQLRLTRDHALLSSGNPRQILARGYTMLIDEQQQVVDYQRFVQAPREQQFNLCFAQGVGQVKKIENGEHLK